MLQYERGQATSWGTQPATTSLHGHSHGVALLRCEPSRAHDEALRPRNVPLPDKIAFCSTTCFRAARCHSSWYLALAVTQLVEEGQITCVKVELIANRGDTLQDCYMSSELSVTSAEPLRTSACGAELSSATCRVLFHC